MEVNFDYYSAFVADEPAITHSVENLLSRNHATEYFILLEMRYKEAASLIKHMTKLRSLRCTVILKRKTKGRALGERRDCGCACRYDSLKKLFHFDFYFKSVNMLGRKPLAHRRAGIPLRGEAQPGRKPRGESSNGCSSVCSLYLQ